MRNPNPETDQYAEVRRVESVLVPQSPAHRSLVAMDWDPLSPRRHKTKLVLMISLSDHGRRQSVGFPGLTPVSTRHGLLAIPIAPLHAGKNREGRFPPCAYAGPGVWTSGGPYGGDILALAINPTTPATLYAGTSGGGVFKSTDSGGTWAAANTGLTNLSVFSLAINPSTPPRSTPGRRRRGLQVHRLRRHLGRRQHGTDEPERLRPGDQSHDPRHALRRDVGGRDLQVHRLRRHLGRRQHGPDEPVRLRPGDQSHDPRHALRRDGTAGSSSPPTPAAPGPPPTRA